MNFNKTFVDNKFKSLFLGQGAKNLVRVFFVLLLVFPFPVFGYSEKTDSLRNDVRFLAPNSFFSFSHRFQKIATLFEKGELFQAIQELTSVENDCSHFFSHSDPTSLQQEVQQYWNRFWESEKGKDPVKSDSNELQEMEKKYPDVLSKILNHNNLSKLLEILTLSRINIDYKEQTFHAEMLRKDASIKGKLTDRIQYAVDNNLYLSLGNGVYTTPLSGSFRRHILFKMDIQSKKIDYDSAVEIKIPGEVKGKQTINPKDFDFAKLYQSKFEDNSVSRVVLVNSIKFDGKLYGKPFQNDVNVIVNRYVKNADRLLNFMDDNVYEHVIQRSKRHYRSEKEVKEDVIRQVFDLVGRMNGGLGLIGRRDMHLENFLISQNSDGRISVKWVNDFSGFRGIFDSDHIRIGAEHLTLEDQDGQDVSVSPEDAYRIRALLRDFEKIYGDCSLSVGRKEFPRKMALVQYIQSYNKYAPKDLQLVLDSTQEFVIINGAKIPLYGKKSFWQSFSLSMDDPDYLSGNPAEEARLMEANVRSSQILYQSNPEKFGEKYQKALDQAAEFFNKYRELRGEVKIDPSQMKLVLQAS